ncbi:hypothetical protein SAMN04487776_11922 [Priestia megaterium]|jgi:hypothetical protein|nr:hypothetical protein SAMN04487776_11922 [Priestia megaterium]
MVLGNGEEIVEEYKWKRRVTIVLTNKRLIIRDKKQGGFRDGYSIFLKEVVNTTMLRKTSKFSINLGIVGFLGFVASIFMGEIFTYAKFYGPMILLSYILIKRSDYRFVITFSSGRRKGITIHNSHKKELLELMDLIDAKVAEVA